MILYRKFIKTALKMQDKIAAKLNIKPVSRMIYIVDIAATITKSDKLLAFTKSKLPQKLLCGIFPETKEEDNAHILFTSGSEKDQK